MNTPLFYVDELVESIEPTDPSPDALLRAMDMVAVVKERAKKLGELLEEKAIAWINANGDLIRGDIRYYVGSVTHHKCDDKRKALDLILVAGGGDIDSLVNSLTSDCFKPGACKDLLGDDGFASVFTTITMADLKTGKPLKRLKKHDPKFTK